MISEQVPVLNMPDREQFWHFTNSLTQPVKVTGLISRWKPVSNWSIDYLREVAGDCIVRACPNDQNGSWYEHVAGRDGSGWINLPVRDFITLLLTENPQNYYAGQISIDDLPPLQPDIQQADFLRLVDSPTDLIIRFWLGKNNPSQLHYDLFHTLTIQIFGQKQVTLFAPTDLNSFYPMDDPKLITTSNVRNPLKVDPEKFPKFLQNKPISVSLSEGDILFIPVFWWHFMEGGESTNLSLSYHFVTDTNTMLASPYLHHYLRGTGTG